jgi:hypothetical protein
MDPGVQHDCTPIDARYRRRPASRQGRRKFIGATMIMALILL